MTNHELRNGEMTKDESVILKAVAVLFMVLLHLFDKASDLPFQPLFNIAGKPFEYWCVDFMGCCIGIFSFCSGYAFRLLYKKNHDGYYKSSLKRLNLW